MIDELIVPRTVVREKGDSAPVGIGAASHRIFLVVLEITAAVEQEAIEISFFGSSDGATWGAKPLATLPQRFYPGKYPSLLDLTRDTEAAVLRAHWEPVRWGRGDLVPYFEFSLSLREVSPEVLKPSIA